MKDESIKMSLPETKELHGVKIVKLPVARYIKALNTLENLPNIIINSVLPEFGGLSGLLIQLQSGDGNVIEKVIVRLLTAVPTEFCRLVSELLNIPEERLLDVESNAPLSLNDLIEIIIAFWEMNDMTDFFGNVQQLKKLTAPKTADTGYKDGLQLPKA